MVNVMGDALATGIMAHICRKDFMKEGDGVSFNDNMFQRTWVIGVIEPIVCFLGLKTLLVLFHAFLEIWLSSRHLEETEDLSVYLL